MYNLQQRKSLRFKKYDYSSNGYYFITICTKDRENFFGEVIGGKMILNEFGNIAEIFFKDINNHFKNAYADEFIIMPNHIHGIIIIDNITEHTVGNADLHSLHNAKDNLHFLPEWQQKTKMLLSKIIHGYKSSITRKIRNNFDNFLFGWQKSFYDVIIKNNEQLEKSRQYIIENPEKWDIDLNNKINI